MYIDVLPHMTELTFVINVNISSACYDYLQRKRKKLANVQCCFVRYDSIDVCAINSSVRGFTKFD